MIPLTQTEEQLQRAHLTALAAKARCNLIIRGGTSGGDYGVDGEFRIVKQYTNGLGESGEGIDFQAKATKRVRFLKREPFVAYDMEVEDYNKLVEVNNDRSSPCLLIVLCLPQDVEEWLSHSEDSLILKHCCYWHVLNGEETANGNTQVVKIPKARFLSPEGLIELLARVARKEPLV